MTTFAEVNRLWTDAGRERWFRRDDAFDALLRERLLEAHHVASRREFEDWMETPEGALALVLLLDQVPRNIFRQSGHAYATDGLARHYAGRAVAQGFDAKVVPDQRLFFTLPFQHSEALEDQDRALELAHTCNEDFIVDACERHREVILRFGRYPHRNAELGRINTPEEQAYLDEGGGFIPKPIDAAATMPAPSSTDAASALPSPGDVVRFWEEAGRKAWFTADPAFDARLRERFEAAHFAASRRELEHWMETPEGALALQILLDQFPRNCFRKSGHSYATDGLARFYADLALQRGFDARVDPALRFFLYMAFEHSESLVDQDRSVALMGDDPDLGKWAVGHRDAIVKFGRFPHRNPELGRRNTPEEQAYLDGGGGFVTATSPQENVD